MAKLSEARLLLLLGIVSGVLLRLPTHPIDTLVYVVMPRTHDAIRHYPAAIGSDRIKESRKFSTQLEVSI